MKINLSGNKIFLSVLTLFFLIFAVNAVTLDRTDINPTNTTWITGGANQTINFTIVHSNTTSNITQLNITNANFTFYTSPAETGISINATGYACSVLNATALNCSNTSTPALWGSGMHVDIGINKTRNPTGVFAMNHTWSILAADNSSTSPTVTTLTQVSQVDGVNPTYSANANNSGTGNYSGKITNITISYNFSDVGSGILNNTWALTNASGNQTPYQTLTNITGTTYNVSSISDGTYNVTLQLYDNANNSNWTNLTSITVDNTNPIYNANSNNSAAGNYSGKITNITISYNFSDATSGIYNNTWVITNASGNQTPYQTLANITGTTYNVSGLSDGVYNVTINLYDYANNSNHTNVTTITVDNTRPLISYNNSTDADGANLSRNWIFVNVSLTETNLRNITYTLYYVNGTLVNSTNYTNATTTLNWTNLSDARYTFNVTTYDAANNTNSTSSRNVTVDTTQPGPSLTLNVNSIKYYDKVDATCTASDNLDSVLSFTIKLTKPLGQEISKSGSGTSFTASFKDTDTDTVGTNTITCTVTDDSGNFKSDDESLSITDSGSSSGGSGGSGGGSSTPSKTTVKSEPTPVQSTPTTTTTPQPTVEEKDKPVVEENDKPVGTEQKSGSVFERLTDAIENAVGYQLPASAGLGLVTVVITFIIVGGAGYLLFNKYKK